MKKNSQILLKDNVIAITICLICGLILAFSLFRLVQLNNNIPSKITQIVEEHYDIGYNVYSTGELSFLGYPSIFRSPGYPVFVAISLHVRDILEIGVKPLLQLPILSYLLQDTLFVVAVQFATVLIAGFVFYKALRFYIHKTPAILFTVAYLINPYTLAIIMRVSYPALVFCIITCVIYLFSYLLQKESIRIRDIVLLSVFFGLAALIRPIFLTSPILILGFLWLIKKIKFKRSLGLAVLFSIIMVGVILPYSVRNYLVSGKFHLISNQGPWVFWGNSVIDFYSEGNKPDWIDVYFPYGEEIHTRVTGKEYSLEGLYRYSNELSSAFGREFIINLRSNPSIYVNNVLNNIYLYMTSPRQYYEQEYWDLIPENSNEIVSIRYIFSNTFQMATIFAVPLLGFLSYKKIRSAKLGLLLYFYILANYSIGFLIPRFMGSILPVILFSLAIGSHGLILLLDEHRRKLVPNLSLVSSVVMVLLFSSPIAYLLMRLIR